MHGKWWDYPRDFYWFSPLPVNVKWHELLIILVLNTLLGLALDYYLNATLVERFTWFLEWITGSETVSSEEDSPMELIKSIASKLVEIDDVHPDDDLVGIGLNSLTAAGETRKHAGINSF